MTTVFSSKPEGMFIRLTQNIRRKEIKRTKVDYNFLKGTFIKRNNVRAPIQFESERKFQHLKR